MRAALALAAMLALSACGLHPMYAGGSRGVVAQTLARIEIAPIRGQQGWLMHNALTDRLAADGHADARYRLEVELDDQITGFGVRTDNTVTRERRVLRARYRLVDIETGTVLLDATAGQDAGIDVVQSEYAVIAAEQTALENLTQAVADQIVQRVALYAHHGGRAPGVDAPPPPTTSGK